MRTAQSAFLIAALLAIVPAADLAFCADFNVELVLKDRGPDVACSLRVIGASPAPPRSRWMMLPLPNGLLSPSSQLSFGTRQSNQVALLSKSASQPVAALALFPGSAKTYSVDLAVDKAIADTSGTLGFAWRGYKKVLTVPFSPDSSLVPSFTHKDSSVTCRFANVTVFIEQGTVGSTKPSGKRMLANVISIPFDRIVQNSNTLEVTFIPFYVIIQNAISIFLAVILAFLSWHQETLKRLTRDHHHRASIGGLGMVMLGCVILRWAYPNINSSFHAQLLFGSACVLIAVGVVAVQPGAAALFRRRAPHAIDT